MLATVELDQQSPLQASEICDEPAHRILAAELQTLCSA
jgi:hypothetical protein